MRLVSSSSEILTDPTTRCPAGALLNSVALAANNDGLLTSDQARGEHFSDSVLARLVQRGRIVRIARGVYRIPYLSPGRFSQYREVVVWAKANRGSDPVALSHATALVVYGISDSNPATIHLTVPRSARLRRKTSKARHRATRRSLRKRQFATRRNPVTTIERTITHLLQSGGRTDLLKQAVSDARREGYISDAGAAKLRRVVARQDARTLLPGRVHHIRPVGFIEQLFRQKSIGVLPVARENSSFRNMEPHLPSKLHALCCGRRRL